MDLLGIERFKLNPSTPLVFDPLIYTETNGKGFELLTHFFRVLITGLSFYLIVFTTDPS